MSSHNRYRISIMSAINNLHNLVNRFLKAKTDGSLEGASEATMRTWIDELLVIIKK